MNRSPFTLFLETFIELMRNHYRFDLRQGDIEWGSDRVKLDDNLLIVGCVFTGPVTGMYLLGAHKKEWEDCFAYTGDEDNELLFSHMREVMNLSVGTSFSALKEEYPYLTFHAPWIFNGGLILPKFDFFNVNLKGGDDSEFRALLVLDCLKQDIGEALEKSNKERLMVEGVASSLHEKEETMRYKLVGLEEALEQYKNTHQFMTHFLKELDLFCEIEKQNGQLLYGPLNLHDALEKGRYSQSIIGSIYDSKLKVGINIGFSGDKGTFKRDTKTSIYLGSFPFSIDGQEEALLKIYRPKT